MSAPAIGFALAPIIAFAVFAMAILDSRGASPYGGRPWGDLSPDDRARLTRWCAVGLVVSMIALILFAIFGAVVLAGSEEVLSADDAQSLQALLRVGLFIIYVPAVAGAAALLWWTNWASLAAAYILLLVAVRLVLVVLRPVPHFVAYFIDRIDEVLVQLLRLISSPPIALWNTFCAGRQVGRRSLPEVRVCVSGGRSTMAALTGRAIPMPPTNATARNAIGHLIRRHSSRGPFSRS